MTLELENAPARLPRLPRPSARLAMRLQAPLAQYSIAPAIQPDDPGLWLRLIASDGRTLLLRPPRNAARDAAHSLLWMAQIEDAIVAFERGLGARFAVGEPASEAPPDFGIVLLSHDGEALLLAADANAWADGPRPPLPASSFARPLRAVIALSLRAPTLSPPLLARLKSEACLLLVPYARTLVAAAFALDASCGCAGGFDPASRAFHVHSLALQKENRMDPLGSISADPWDAYRSTIADATIAMDVRLPRVEAKVGDLAALRPQALLPLEIEGETLNVEILANGRLFALGHVVSMGDAFGVIVDRLCGPEDAR